MLLLISGMLEEVKQKIDKKFSYETAFSENPHYTFRPDELVYRGKSRTSQVQDEFIYNGHVDQ